MREGFTALVSTISFMSRRVRSALEFEGNYLFQLEEREGLSNL